MLAALSLLVILQTPPQTYEQVLLKMHDAYAGVTSFRETWITAQTPEEEGAPPVKLLREKDGGK